MLTDTDSFYVASLLAERWLRYIDRLPTDIRKREEILCMCSTNSTRANGQPGSVLSVRPLAARPSSSLQWYVIHLRSLRLLTWGPV